MFELCNSLIHMYSFQAPIHMSGIEGRYATALYSAAHKEKQLEAVEKDLKDIQAGLKKKGKLADYLYNPSLQRGEKMELLGSAMAKTKASKLTTNLMSKSTETIFN
jgi:F-type H+-transporting ATPase subunit O